MVPLVSSWLIIINGALNYAFFNGKWQLPTWLPNVLWIIESAINGVGHGTKLDIFSSRHQCSCLTFISRHVLYMPELCTDLGKWKSSAKLFKKIFDDTVHPNSPMILEKTSSSVSSLASIISPDSIRKQSQKNAKIKLHWPKRFLCVELDKKVR